MTGLLGKYGRNTLREKKSEGRCRFRWRKNTRKYEHLESAGFRGNDAGQ